MHLQTLEMNLFEVDEHRKTKKKVLYEESNNPLVRCSGAYLYDNITHGFLIDVYDQMFVFSDGFEGQKKLL